MSPRCSLRIARRWTSLGAALVLAAGTVAGPAAAQETQEVPAGDDLFFETVDVNVVNVDVFVTDKKGNPVTDLGPGDFELLADGEPVEITNFYAAVQGQAQPSAEAAAPAEEDAYFEPLPLAEGRPEEQKLNLIVLVDNLNIRAHNRNAVFEVLEGFLDGSLREGDRVLVVTYDGEMEVRGSFSEQPEDLLPLIDRLAQEPGRGDELDREMHQVLEEMVEGMPIDRGGFSPHRPEDVLQSTLASAQAYAQRTRNRVRTTINSIELLVGQMAGITGRKAVVYVSDGLPLRPGDAMFRMWFATFQGVGDSDGILSPEAETQTFDLTAEFRDLVESANASGVMIHTLDAGGHVTGRGPSASGFSHRLQGLWTHEVDAVHTANLRESLRWMAEGTGGRALLGRTNLAEALDGVARDLDTYYSLGFQPVETEKSQKKKERGKTHRLEVKVKGEGLRVRHREGFQVKDATERAAEGTLATALFKLGENPLGIALEAGTGVPVDGGKYEVPILVKVPLGRLVLVPQPEIHQGKISMFLAARDEDGRSSPVRRVSFPVRVPNDQLFTALGQHVSYTFKLQMREGEQTVAVGVRDEVAAVNANTAMDLSVPGPPVSTEMATSNAGG